MTSRNVKFHCAIEFRLFALLLAVVVPRGARAQSVSPYEYAGIRLPMTAIQLRTMIAQKPQCSSDRRVRVTTCTVAAFAVTRGDVGTYDLEWEVNDPTGRVQAVTIAWRSTARMTDSLLPALVRRWGAPSRQEDSYYVWWGGEPGSRWMVTIERWTTTPDTRTRITLRDVMELEQYNARARRIHR